MQDKVNMQDKVDIQGKLNTQDKANMFLDVQQIKKFFPIYGGILYRKKAEVQALNSVSFSIKKGETLGIVGESGCGKSTLGKTLLRLYEPDSGKAYFEGVDLFQLKGKDLKEMRKNIQMIFQDPFSSLNPRMTVEEIVREPFDIFHMERRENRTKRVKELMDVVGLRPDMINRYPHEFSGGQRQRIGIARALALKPKLIVADEPVSALDVSIQAQILNLMNQLQKEFQLTYIFITHNLSVVEYVSDSLAIMYLGHIVEKAPKERIFKTPQHPYTASLLSAIPIPDPKRKKSRILLKGEVPSALNPPSGCTFHPRCSRASSLCREQKPALLEIYPEHLVACHHRLGE